MSTILTSKPLYTVPPYKQIEENLRSRVSGGEWDASAMLPSRRKLARHYGVELATIQRAMSGLLEDGTLRADGSPAPARVHAAPHDARMTFPEWQRDAETVAIAVEAEEKAVAAIGEIPASWMAPHAWQTESPLRRLNVWPADDSVH